MKTYTTIPTNIGKLIFADIFRFTCLTFQPRKNGYTDTTIKQLMIYTKDKSDDTLKDFIKRLRESELIEIQTIKSSSSADKTIIVNRNHYYIPEYQEKFRFINKSIFNCDLSLEYKGFLIGLFAICLNGTKTCKLSIIDIAKSLNVHRNTVSKYIKELIELGFINKIKGGFELVCEWLLISNKREKLIEYYKEIGLDKVYKIDWSKVKNPEKYANSLLSGTANLPKKQPVETEQIIII